MRRVVDRQHHSHIGRKNRQNSAWMGYSSLAANRQKSVHGMPTGIPAVERLQNNLKVKANKGLATAEHDGNNKSNN